MTPPDSTQLAEELETLAGCQNLWHPDGDEVEIAALLAGARALRREAEAESGERPTPEDFKWLDWTARHGWTTGGESFRPGASCLTRVLAAARALEAVEREKVMLVASHDMWKQQWKEASARLARAEEALREILETVNDGQEGTTHWEGCEDTHWRCRLASLLTTEPMEK